MIATVSGLDSITVGWLSERTGVSKSGILTVFGSREAIQVAAVAEARRIYQEHVVGAGLVGAGGRPRLRALLRSWVDYLKAGVFPGGCFIAATSVSIRPARASGLTRGSVARADGGPTLGTLVRITKRVVSCATKTRDAYDGC